MAAGGGPARGFAYLTCRRLAQGVTVRSVFALWGTFVLVDFALEAPGLLTGVDNSYGHQPFNLWGHPMWWGCANTFTALAAGEEARLVREVGRPPAQDRAPDRAPPRPATTPAGGASAPGRW